MGIARYPHRLDKLAIAVVSGTQAKEEVVKLFGIGEDLPMSIFFWKQNRMEVVLSAQHKVQKASPLERFKKITDAVSIVKKAWGIDAITMVAEGWVSTNPDATYGRELHVAYLDKDSPVKECLTVTHVENNEVTFIAKPYRQTWGRKVEWEDELYFPGETNVRGQDAMYPNLFAKILTNVDYVEPPTAAGEYFSTLERGLDDRGFTFKQM